MRLPFVQTSPEFGQKRHEHELRRHAEQQTVVANLGHAALRGESVRSLLDQVSVAVPLLLETDIAGILHQIDGRFHLVGGTGWPEGVYVDLPTAAMAEYTLRADGPVITSNLATEKRFAPPYLLLEKGAVSGITVPISTGHGAAWGVLGSHSFRRREFTVNDIEFLRAVATVLAQAIERDRLNHQLVQHARQQSAIAELSRVALKSVDDAIAVTCTLIEEVLDTDEVRFLEREDEVPEGFVAVPVVSTNGRFGVFAASAKEGQTLSDADVEFMQALAHILAEGLEHEQSGRETRRQLEQADRLTSLGRMAATIAHEFNNVLMGISPFVEVIRRGKSIDSSLDHIGRAVKRGKRVTEEILRFTRHAQPHRAAFDVAPWFDSIIFEARTVVPTSCRIETSIEAHDLVIDGDANQLQQIFTNLILNARDAMPTGGKLTLEVRREPVDAKMPFGVVDQPERFAHCIVRDTGCGMSAETQRHLYEPMFTTKKNGTGLGLAVVHQVVQRHSGVMFVESKLDFGTTFHVFLPLGDPANRPQSVVDAMLPARIGRHVLLVEDDRAVAVGLASLLELEGLRVDVVETGAAAIRAIDNITPDIVVLDVGLPDMEGTIVYKAIAAKLPNVPVIFSTGHADRALLDALLEQPNVGYLLKPYAGSVLLEAIENALA